MATTNFENGTRLVPDWLNDVDEAVYTDLAGPGGLASTATGKGASLVGVADVDGDWQSSNQEGVNKEVGYQIASNRIPALKYIPISLWTGLQAGTETSDIGPYIMSAVSEAAANGGIVMLPQWTMCHSTQIAWSAKGVGLDGGMPKHGVTASSADGCCLKWTGVSGGTQVKVTQGGHNAYVRGIMFDANDLADTCLHFSTSGVGTPEIMHMPGAEFLRFVGYRGAACIFGNSNTSVLDTGQMQQAFLRDCSWWGGGPTATEANVFGLVLNAQNCEVLVCSNLFFDPYWTGVGGTQCRHQSHIKVRTGGLSLLGATFTRSISYNVDIAEECGLVLNHVRTEDPLLLRIAAGFQSNPVDVRNVEGRDGTAVGSEVFISIQGGGGTVINLQNIRSTGHIQIAGANDNSVTTKNIRFVTPGVSSLSITGGTPYAGKYELATDPGVKVIRNASAIETWTDLSNATLYRNDRGRVRVKSLQGASASADALNFGGAATVGALATTHTVTFGTAEPDTNYRVILTMNVATGTPAAGSNRIVSVAKTVNDFTVTFEAAAGAGNSVSFAWLIFRA